MYSYVNAYNWLATFSVPNINCYCNKVLVYCFYWMNFRSSFFLNNWTEHFRGKGNTQTTLNCYPEIKTDSLYFYVGFFVIAHTINLSASQYNNKNDGGVLVVMLMNLLFFGVFVDFKVFCYFYLQVFWCFKRLYRRICSIWALLGVIDVNLPWIYFHCRGWIRGKDRTTIERNKTYSFFLEEFVSLL